MNENLSRLNSECPLCHVEGEFQFKVKGMPTYNIPDRIAFKCPKCNTLFYKPDRKDANK